MFGKRLVIKKLKEHIFEFINLSISLKNVHQTLMKDHQVSIRNFIKEPPFQDTQNRKLIEFKSKFNWAKSLAHSLFPPSQCLINRILSS